MKTISTYTRLLCFALISLIATGCSDYSEELAPDSLPAGHFTLKASQQGADTRLELGQDGLTVQWEPGDQLVLVEKSRSKAPIYLSCTLTEPATRATFVSESGVPAGDYWVIYNYNENLAYTHQSFSSIDEINAQDKLVLYGELNITAGTSSATVEMKHLYAMVKIKLQNIPNSSELSMNSCTIGMYSSKKGLPIFKQFTSNGLVNAEYGINPNGMDPYQNTYFPSDKKWHNIRLGGYQVQSSWNEADLTTTVQSEQTTFSALVIPEDLSDEDVFFYLLHSSYENGDGIKCYEIKKAKGLVNLKAGTSYTVTLDLSDVNTIVSHLPKSMGNMDYIGEISTPAQWRCAAYTNKKFDYHTISKYSITDNIDFTNEYFFPISIDYIDGNDKTLSNITLEWPDDDNVGLYKNEWNWESIYDPTSGNNNYSMQNRNPREYGCIIRNLTLSNVNIKGKSHVGAFGGYNVAAENCKVIGTSTISGSGDYVGGIVGWNRICTSSADMANLSIGELSISKCSIGQNCKVTGGNLVGGIVGAYEDKYSYGGGTAESSKKPLYDCESSATVTATGNYIGGIFGKIGGTPNSNYSDISFSMEDYTYSIIKCKNHGTVTGNNYVGGIGGSFAMSCNSGGLDRVILKQSFSDGTVEGNTFVGGIVGGSYASINTCYTVNSITGLDQVGGIMGIYEFGNGGRVTNCYSLANVEATGGIIAVSGGIVGISKCGAGMGITVANSYFAGTGTSHGIIGKTENGGCTIDNCLTILASFCSNWNNGGGMYPNSPTAPVQEGEMKVGVTSILDHKDFINGDNAYSSNYWPLETYPWYCIKFDSFSAETDAPDFGNEVIP